MESIQTTFSSVPAKLAADSSDALARCDDAINLWDHSTSETALSALTIGRQFTPMRMMRQVAAELQRKKDAMTEAKYTVMKRLKRAEIKRAQAVDETDPLREELLLIEAEELEEKAKMVERPYVGAMKAVVELGRVYDKLKENILAKHGELSETAFEAEEEQANIKRAYAQSMRDIRMQKSITTGNQEYLEQIGLNPLMVQNEIYEFLASSQGDCSDSSSIEKFLDDAAARHAKKLNNRLERIGLR